MRIKENDKTTLAFIAKINYLNTNIYNDFNIKIMYSFESELIPFIARELHHDEETVFNYFAKNHRFSSQYEALALITGKCGWGFDSCRIENTLVGRKIEIDAYPISDIDVDTDSKEFYLYNIHNRYYTLTDNYDKFVNSVAKEICREPNQVKTFIKDSLKTGPELSITPPYIYSNSISDDVSGGRVKFDIYNVGDYK